MQFSSRSLPLFKKLLRAWNNNLFNILLHMLYIFCCNSTLSPTFFFLLHSVYQFFFIGIAEVIRYGCKAAKKNNTELITECQIKSSSEKRDNWKKKPNRCGLENQSDSLLTAISLENLCRCNDFNFVSDFLNFWQMKRVKAFYAQAEKYKICIGQTSTSISINTHHITLPNQIQLEMKINHLYLINNRIWLNYTGVAWFNWRPYREKRVKLTWLWLLPFIGL